MMEKKAMADFPLRVLELFSLNILALRISEVPAVAEPGTVADGCG